MDEGVQGNMTEEEIDQTILDTDTDGSHYDKRHYVRCMKVLKEQRDFWKAQWAKLALVANEVVK